jgi:hypothetical protein
MGWLSVALGGLAAFLFWGTGHTLLMVLAIVLALVCLWSWGVMHNYATEAAKHRSNYNGGFYDITAQEANSVPNWITNVNIISTLGSVALLVTALISRFV